MYVVVAWNLYHSICVLVLRRCKQPIEIVLGLFFSSIWDIKIPPRVQYFLWLLSKNKLLTRDNLSKRRKVEDPTCLFCNERESIQHLFFSCAIAKQLWHVLSKIFDIQLIASFEDIGKFWLNNKHNGVLNMFTLAAVWCL
jgi:hypothetical protein